MQVAYSGKKGNVQRYSCHQAHRMQGSDICQSLGGKRLDQTVVSIFLKAITPARMEALVLALEEVEANFYAEKALLEKQLEKAQYEADRARRQYDRVEPENRLVARTMEKAWEERLQEVYRLEQRIQKKENHTYSPLTSKEKQQMQFIGSHIQKIWKAETTTNRDQKELLRLLISDIIVVVDRENHQAHCTIVWESGAITPFTSKLNKTGRHSHSTDEEIVHLVRQLALYYPDEMIARILIRQQKKTGKGNSFTAGRVNFLRNHYGILAYKGKSILESKRYTVAEVATELQVSTATVLRWLREGFIKGHQLTSGAPWEIEITDDLRKRIVQETPKGWVSLKEAAVLLNCTKQTVLNRMRNGKLEAIYVQHGKRKGFRFRVSISTENQGSLFDPRF
jgi:hypothetical protein